MMDEGRRDFIACMAKLARDEPGEFHNGDGLMERTLQYAGSAVPRVTRGEVEEVLGDR